MAIDHGGEGLEFRQRDDVVSIPTTVEDDKLVISATDESLQAMTLYLEFSKMMLNSCTAKHIILYDKTVQAWINSEYNASLKRLKSKMGMCELPIQLQLEDNLVSRVFFPTVDPCKILFKGDLASVQKLDNTVNIAAWLRSIPGVPTRHFELKGFLTLFATEVRKQREGGDIVTMDTLHPWLKTWLRREGFVADDGALLESDSPGQTLLDTIQVLISEKGAMNSARNRQYRFAKRIRDAGLGFSLQPAKTGRIKERTPKHTRYSKDEDRKLQAMRQADASWEEIARAFPNRIPAALKAHVTHLKQRGSVHDLPAVMKGVRPCLNPGDASQRACVLKKVGRK